MRIIDGWPSADALLDAYQRIALHHLTSAMTPLVGTTVTTRAPNYITGRC